MQGQTKRHELQIPAKIAKLFKDYGFLETSDGREIYFHRNGVLDNHFEVLRVGSEVHFTEESGEKGPQASTVSLLHPNRQIRKSRTSGPVRKAAYRPAV
jgi:cold shock CspA family protein